VPRFYLDVVDGDQVIQDLEGIDFDDLQTALRKQQAAVFAWGQTADTA
jgi:hypothetical protein